MDLMIVVKPLETDVRNCDEEISQTSPSEGRRCLDPLGGRTVAIPVTFEDEAAVPVVVYRFGRRNPETIAGRGATSD